jgi:ADP-ribose pyrophosphatase
MFGMRTVVPKNARLVPPKAKKVFAGQIFEVYQWQQEQFDGSYATFEMLKRPDTVNVFAIRDDKLVILKQQQPGSAVFYGPPGGRHDNPDETELEAAQRELLEEAGLTFRNWKLVRVEQPVGKMEWFIYSFVATGFEQETEPSPDAGEKIEVEYLTLDEVRSLAGKVRTIRADLPAEIFDNLASIDELANLPAYGGGLS